MALGKDLKDGFNKHKNCVEFRLNKPNTPDCLIGYANRDVIAGEIMYGELGKVYWSHRYRQQELQATEKGECMAYYKITDRDIKD